VSCAKTAEPIDMLFCTKTRVGRPRNHVLDGSTDPPTVRGNFRGLFGSPGHSKASAIFAAAVAAARWLQKRSFNHQYRHAAEGIIQYARQVQIGIRKILSKNDDGSAQRGRSVISTIALFATVSLVK